MQHIRTEDIIIIDIETVSEKPFFTALHESWQQLWQGKVEKQLPQDVTAADFYTQRAGVMAESLYLRRPTPSLSIYSKHFP